MSSKNSNNDMSDLEREFELEMDDQSYSGSMEEGEQEYEYDEHSFENEYNQDEYEEELEHEAEYETTSFGERLYELSQREFESEWERNEALDEIFEDIEREYFWGKIKRAVRKVARNPIVKGLVKKGWALASKKIPQLSALKGITQIARGNLKGAAVSMARAGVGQVIPGSAGIFDKVTSALGVSNKNRESENIEAFNHFTDGVARSYEFLADNLQIDMDDPIVANQLASRAFEAGIGNSLSVRKNQRFPKSNSRSKVSSDIKGLRTIRLRVRNDEVIEKIVIEIVRQP